ncbi:MAG: DNA primase [Mariprofundaceae bacterium]|nr:DNA primase [Mariprofundaceae bacterium]
MAQFSPAFLDEVLARTDLAEIIGRHVELKRSGSNLMGLCPFHHEKSPSFSVSPDKQLYYCFGCGKGGGAFQFLMEHDGYAFPEAVEYLAEKAGIEVPRQAASDPGETERRNRAFELLLKVADLFARQLAGEKGVVAREYLNHRKLPEKIIRDYKLGYAPAGYGFLQHCFGSDARTSAQLESIGVLFKGDHGYVDRFRNRLMFPIRDRRGKTVGFGGRILGDEKSAKYLNSPETPFFHKSDLLYGLAEHREEIRRRRLLLVVEGYMDVLALAAHGLPIGLAPLGTAIGERQILEILRLHDGPVFCFDGDRAGRQAAWRALERMLPVLKAEHSPRFLYLPEGEDPDSLVGKEGSEAFSKRIEREARPVMETWLQGLRNIAGQGRDGDARMAKKADTMLKSMTDHFLADAWRNEASQKTGVPITQKFIKSDAGTVRLKADRMSAEEKFVAGLLQNPARFSALTDEDSRVFLDTNPVNGIYTRAFFIIQNSRKGEISSAELMKKLADSATDDPNLALWSNAPDIEDEVFSNLLATVRANVIRRRLKGGIGLQEAVELKRRLNELDGQRRGNE